MNKICKFCDHYVDGNNRTDGISVCGQAGYRSDEYGTFKTGANCTFDSDIKNLFKPIPKGRVEKELKLRIEAVGEMRIEIDDKDREIEELKRRLISIGVGND